MLIESSGKTEGLQRLDVPAADGSSETSNHLIKISRQKLPSAAPLAFQEIESPDVTYCMLENLEAGRRNKSCHQQYILTALK
ncbi:hypothetical protein [Planococcus lenghuensis]|uniref:Uncharacterized protein n=1 Tax=Planococcus lenghuensis TaxID=2213202 RepID=A0A1Q2KWL2_9BACL|nr:hypothetical protein [Planococcus lenghuensis]AQQ52580.1 hypothetical protein B0X71_05370 [Planococcus lenghuensis]